MKPPLPIWCRASVARPSFDNLRSVDVVSAAGEMVHASDEDNPELFWGVRGGGGNFGIVTSFEFRLHSVGPIVLGGLVLHPLEKLPELMRFYREYVSGTPDELTTLLAIITAPPAPFVPEHLQGQRVAAIATCYAGSPEDGEDAVRPLREFGPPETDIIGPIPYIVLQSLFDPSAPPGQQNYWKSHYLAELGNETIDAIVDGAARLPQPFSQIHVHQLGGAMSRVGSDETAFAHRDASFVLNIIGMWEDPAQDDGASSGYELYASTSLRRISSFPYSSSFNPPLSPCEGVGGEGAP